MDISNIYFISSIFNIIFDIFGILFILYKFTSFFSYFYNFILFIGKVFSGFYWAVNEIKLFLIKKRNQEVFNDSIDLHYETENIFTKMYNWVFKPKKNVMYIPLTEITEFSESKSHNSLPIEFVRNSELEKYFLESGKSFIDLQKMSNTSIYPPGYSNFKSALQLP